jgi:predicted transcriptional regulator
MSIKPRWAQGIIKGSKTIELRRQVPQTQAGQPVLLYSTMPEGRIIGWCRISSITVSTPHDAWPGARMHADILEREFSEYFADASIAVSIRLSDAHELDDKPTLAEMRESSAFHPPQTWRFFDSDGLTSMLAGHNALAELLPLFDRRLFDDSEQTHFETSQSEPLLVRPSDERDTVYSRGLQSARFQASLGLHSLALT